MPKDPVEALAMAEALVDAGSRVLAGKRQSPLTQGDLKLHEDDAAAVILATLQMLHSDPVDLTDLIEVILEKWPPGLPD
jgi:hypothetical protein